MNRKCSHFPRCGGCSRLDVPYSRQLDEKLQLLQELFTPFTGHIPEVIPSPEQWNYRHKVQLPFGYAGKGRSKRVVLGCYGADSHVVIDQRECLIQDSDCSKIALSIREWAEKSGLSVYEERSGTGFLRHVLIRKAAGTGEILVGLVTNGNRPAGSRNLARRLLSMIGEIPLEAGTIVGIVQNVNRRNTNIVLGERECVWWGRPYLKEKLGNLRYKVGLSTFFQVNPYQTPQLYNEVLRHISPGERVIDCFCGVGTIASWISEKAAEVHGIEDNRLSVLAARTAAKVNRLRNVTFTAGNAEEELIRSSREGYTCVVVDPPRKGLGENLTDVLAASTVRKVIYVSCNPHSLLRDINALLADFTLKTVQGVDMFPHTDHIECVALLERNS
jgi:23S rRNA (uracil1939-C5)-methyltransferase